MAATQVDIRRWFETAKEQNATHLIVACDTWDWDDYPVYVDKSQDVRKEERRIQSSEMQKVMEVYNINMDMESQLREYRSFNY